MRHPFHALCPYFAMFPEEFVATHLLAYSRPGDLVLDPFCGRGTTVLESLLRSRRALGIDINPVAACIARAKSSPPPLSVLLARVAELESQFNVAEEQKSPSEFFDHCYSAGTLQQVLFLKSELKWRTNGTDCFIAALMLNALHGESHRSSRYVSNRMPRTISTKPAYSIRWWKSHGFVAPERNCFEVIREVARHRFSATMPPVCGEAVEGDARRASELFKDRKGQVGLLITSPPYFNMTDYAEDQWLRLWFLGGPDVPTRQLYTDDRHREVGRYWQFLRDVWAGVADLLRDQAVIVVRIGGKGMDRSTIRDALLEGLSSAMPSRRIAELHSGSQSSVGRGQVNYFRPGVEGPRMEHDFVLAVEGT